jgi:CheY-like chemotaxis protein
MACPSKSAGAGSPSSRQLRVLVVDDDRDGRLALGILLRQAGMDVALAASVPEARRSLERMAPDAVLSDLVMPEEDGFALRGALRAKESEIGHHIPTFAISALSDPEIQRRAAEEGFDAYFVKPCDFQEVFGRLARLAAGGSRGAPVPSPRFG